MEKAKLRHSKLPRGRCMSSRRLRKMLNSGDMGCTKIALKAQDEAAILLRPRRQEGSTTTSCAMLATQIAAGSVTVCGIGWPAKRTDAITGRSGTIPLKLCKQQKVCFSLGLLLPYLCTCRFLIVCYS